MSLTRVEIRNFQSLRKVDVDLGMFTVIIGPSSSGKSAFIRAMRALAANLRGTSMITRGQKEMAITARTDTAVITLERSDRSSAYRLSTGGTELAFTKLGGEVPQHITDALRLDPEPGSVNFAAQFDKPYLVDESGATVARHLGELTNVNTIFEAVRQANKVRSGAASTLKTRKADLEQVKDRMAGFATLPGKLKVLADAELLNERRTKLAAQISRLESAMRHLRILERALARPAAIQPPPAEPLDDALNRFLSLQAALRGYVTKQARLRTAETDLAVHAAELKQAQAALTEALVEAGVCPTCGQRTRAH